MSAVIALILIWGFTLPNWLLVIVFLVAWVSVDYVFYLFHKVADNQEWKIHKLYEQDYHSAMASYYDGELSSQEWLRCYHLIMDSEQLFLCRG